MTAEEMMHIIVVRNSPFNNIEGAVLEMHEWDKEQFIKLVIEWLEGVRLDYYCENCEEFIEDFKEYAEEQL